MELSLPGHDASPHWCSAAAVPSALHSAGQHWTFQPGKAITVTISGPEYRGVLLEARTDGSTNALGSWQLPAPDTKFLQCTGNPQGAITHANTNLKGESTAYSWIPPDSTSPVYFMATVAQQRVFWVNVRSAALKRGKPAILGLATEANAGMAKEKPVLLLGICFLMILVLA
ncbi:putative defense protein 3 [Dissostichus eleginoides]|uniref:Defense protein 3 n=1 Tax=Dissostichus eleginoides TaxID=100907 RepID=A0AAD9C1Y7_DISEL|nr:putative defense protein 3 [Dissostichus eleginoides]